MLKHIREFEILVSSELGSYQDHLRIPQGAIFRGFLAKQKFPRSKLVLYFECFAEERSFETWGLKIVKPNGIFEVLPDYTFLTSFSLEDSLQFVYSKISE